MNSIILENQRLKKIFDDYLWMSQTLIFAKVLSDKGSPFLKSIIINKGSKHGINPWNDCYGWSISCGKNC